MIYVPLAREIWTRLTFHEGHGIGAAEPLLAGITLKKSGEYSITKEKNLPLVTMVDFSGREDPGRAENRLTLFLQTNRTHHLVSYVEGDKLGLLDWLELLMDAVEVAPSTGAVDTLLTLHKADWTAVLDVNQQPLQLLSEPFKWDYRMSEITDMTYLMEVDIVFTTPRGNRANRQNTRVKRAAYAP